MYRIEFEPGDVGVFRSVEEVATAIKSGVITPRARIYHQATDKWLPIEFHPHYRMALEMVAHGNVTASHAATAGPPHHPVTSHSTPPGPRPAIHLPPERPAAAVVAEPQPTHHQPTHHHPVHHEPVHHEPVHHEPPHREPAHHEPAHHEPAHHEPTHREPAQWKPARLEPLYREPARVEPVHVDPPRAAPSHAEPAPVEPTRFEPVVFEPVVPEPEPEFELVPRSRDIRFIPLDQPVSHSHHPIAADSGAMSHLHAPVLQPQWSPPVDHAVPAGDAFDFSLAEPARHVLRPRVRLSLNGKHRRPVLLALAGAALLVSTGVGLSSPALGWNIGLLSLDLPASALLHRESTSQSDGRNTDVAEGPKVVPVSRGPAPRGSPSFGASSAFPAAAPAPAVPDPTRETALAAAPRPAASDSIVAVAPISTDIAMAAPKIPGIAGMTVGKPASVTPVSRYQAAYAAARAELETGIRTSGFGNVFAPEHLTTPQGIRAARLAAGTASAYIAKYRRREAEIEAAYADSVGKSAIEKQAWESRRVLQESPEAAKLAGFLLQEIDSVFGILASQDGAYEIKDGSITFQDAGAAKAYGELRPWLDRQTHEWADTASGPPTTAARVLRAIGSTKLPEGGAF